MAVRLCPVVDVAALVDATHVLARNRVKLSETKWFSGVFWLV